MKSPTRTQLESAPMERRPWVAPCLTAHASLTVLTQSVLGVADAMVLLQIGGGPSGIGGGGNSNTAVHAQGQALQPGSSSPPRH